MHSLYALQNSGSVPCGYCGRPIDVWVHHGYQLSRQGIARDSKVARRRCIDCLFLRTRPSEEVDRLRAAYEMQRTMAREAGIPPDVTSYPFSNGGNPTDWTRKYFAIGHAVHVRGWDHSSDVRPHLTYIPEDPDQVPVSLVFFAAKVFHSDIRLAFLKIIYPFHDLSLPARFEIVNGVDPEVSESAINTLTRGRRFWHKMVRRGRGPDDREQRCREFMALLPDAIARARRTHGKPGTVPLSLWEIAEGFGWHEDTVRNRCGECEIRPQSLRRRAGARIVTD